MLQVRPVGGLLGEQMVDPGYYDLEMLHSPAGHRPGLAKGSNRVRSEIVKGVGHRGFNVSLKDWFYPSLLEAPVQALAVGGSRSTIRTNKSASGTLSNLKN